MSMTSSASGHPTPGRTCGFLTGPLAGSRPASSPWLNHARLALAAESLGGGLLAPRPTHHEPKARHLIVIFLTGGFSHVDTFDHKPRLNREHGKPVPSFGLRPDETGNRPLLGSPFRFHRRGQSGLLISELFPCLGEVADELCVIRSLHTDIVEHFQAVLAMHTGSATVPLPSLGAWLSYGLGTFNPNLPSYVVLCEHLPYAGTQVWDSSFLPPIHQGVRIIPGPDPIPDLQPAGAAGDLARAGAALARGRQPGPCPGPARRRRPARPGSPRFDIARGMMREAPEVLDVTRRDGGDPVALRSGRRRHEPRSPTSA